MTTRNLLHLTSADHTLKWSEYERMRAVCRLASELCNAIDAAEKDIGGHRPCIDIIAELGPACDKAEGR